MIVVGCRRCSKATAANSSNSSSNQPGWKCIHVRARSFWNTVHPNSLIQLSHLMHARLHMHSATAAGASVAAARTPGKNRSNKKCLADADVWRGRESRPIAASGGGGGRGRGGRGRRRGWRRGGGEGGRGLSTVAEGGIVRDHWRVKPLKAAAPAPSLVQPFTLLLAPWSSPASACAPTDPRTSTLSYSS